MNEPIQRVVFDCNVHFQAFTSPRGPAARLLDIASSGEIALFISQYTLDEFADVATRPQIVSKYGIEASAVDAFIAGLRVVATLVGDIPHVFEFPRDPDDAHYVDLAVAAHARPIVSRDRDLLSLRDPETADGRDFLARFPAISILTPPEALLWIKPPT